MTLAERRRQRRNALLAAALELFGTRGYAATSIEELCRTANVSTRYFYEEFSDREDLLGCLYEQLLATAWDEVLATEVPEGPDQLRRETRARVGAFIRALLADPRAARVVCLEAVGVSPAIEARRRRVHLGYAHALTAYFQDFVDEQVAPARDFELVALGMVGAINEIIVDWIERDADGASLDELTDVVSGLFIVLGTSRWGRGVFEEPRDDQARGASAPGSTAGPPE
jgi:AcrR family transcriptional regulator